MVAKVCSLLLQIVMLVCMLCVCVCACVCVCVVWHNYKHLWLKNDRTIKLELNVTDYPGVNFLLVLY